MGAAGVHAGGATVLPDELDLSGALRCVKAAE